MTRAVQEPAPPPVPVMESHSRHVQATARVTEDRVMADAAAGGIAGNAMTLGTYAQGWFGELSLTDCALSLQAAAGAVSRGDLTVAEATLTSQALALDAIFGELARRASLNLGTHLPVTETYLRLALKAQSQSRATFEALAAIKNPPAVYARQANINNGGQQQVNNGATPAVSEQYASARTHPGKTDSAPTELLEDRTHGRTKLDPATAPAASRAHPQLVPMGALDRAAHR